MVNPRPTIPLIRDISDIQIRNSSGGLTPGGVIFEGWGIRLNTSRPL